MFPSRNRDVPGHSFSFIVRGDVHNGNTYNYNYNVRHENHSSNELDLDNYDDLFQSKSSTDIAPAFPPVPDTEGNPFTNLLGDIKPRHDDQKRSLRVMKSKAEPKISFQSNGNNAASFLCDAMSLSEGPKDCDVFLALGKSLDVIACVNATDEEGMATMVSAVGAEHWCVEVYHEDPLGEDDDYHHEIDILVLRRAGDEKKMCTLYLSDECSFRLMLPLTLFHNMFFSSVKAVLDSIISLSGQTTIEKVCIESPDNEVSMDLPIHSDDLKIFIRHLKRDTIIEYQSIDFNKNLCLALSNILSPVVFRKCNFKDPNWPLHGPMIVEDFQPYRIAIIDGAPIEFLRALSNCIQRGSVELVCMGRIDGLLRGEYGELYRKVLTKIWSMAKEQGWGRWTGDPTESLHLLHRNIVSIEDEELAKTLAAAADRAFVRDHSPAVHHAASLGMNSLSSGATANTDGWDGTILARSKRQSGWKCGTCTLRNDAEADACASCESIQPDDESSSAVPPVATTGEIGPSGFSF